MTATRCPSLLLTAACLAAFFMAGAARAQPLCGTRQDQLAYLERRWGERVVARAIDSQGRLVEVLRARAGETYSILITRPGGLSCIASGGHDWQDVSPDWPDPGA